MGYGIAAAWAWAFIFRFAGNYQAQKYAAKQAYKVVFHDLKKVD
jgi:hypothetical protein